MPEWRTKKNKDGSTAYSSDGKPIRFAIEPHGDKRSLPKALRQVSLSEITDAIQDRRREQMTADEIAEEEMLEDIVDEEQMQKSALEKLKDGIAKVDKALKKEQVRSEYRDALEQVKQEHMADDVAEIEDGYGEAWQEQFEKKRKARQKDLNPLMGDVT